MESDAEVLACVLAAIEAGSFPLEDEQDMAVLLAALARLTPPPVESGGAPERVESRVEHL